MSIKSNVYFDQIYDEYQAVKRRIPEALNKYTVDYRIYKIYYSGYVYHDDKYDHIKSFSNKKEFYVTNADTDKYHFIRGYNTKYNYDIIKAEVNLHLLFFSINDKFPYDLFNDSIYFLFKKYNFDITYNNIGYKLFEDDAFIFKKETLY